MAFSLAWTPRFGMRTLLAPTVVAAIVFSLSRWILDDGRQEVNFVMFVPRELLHAPPSAQLPVHVALALRWPGIDPRDEQACLEDCRLAQLEPSEERSEIDPSKGAMCKVTLRIRRGQVEWMRTSTEFFHKVSAPHRELVLRPGARAGD